jgi:hypothetical protein
MHLPSSFCKCLHLEAHMSQLPDLDGLELAAPICQRSPHTVIVLISGYFHQEDIAITEGLHEGLFIGFISNPNPST